jgi:DNA-binding beta-propeller fold protein YncE
MKIRFREPRSPVRAALIAAALAALALALPVAAPAAGPAVPPLLWQSPVDGLSGNQAGELFYPSGIAADSTSGHVYVSEKSNARVSEFDAWGQFVKAWGWGVADGSEEPQACGPGASPPTATCLPGIAGSGPGQFGVDEINKVGPSGGIAVDASGDVYVADIFNFRIEKFDSDGNFILAFGDGVNETTGGDVCTAASDDVCGQGTPGEGGGQLAFMNGTYLALGPTGTVFVGQPKGTIQAFEADGTFKEKIVLEDELDGREVTSLAVDSAGDFYVAAGGEKRYLYKFDPTGMLLTALDVEFELEYFNEFHKEILTTTTGLAPEPPLAVDEADNLYVPLRYGTNGTVVELISFDSSGKLAIPPAAGAGFAAAQMAGKENLGFNGLATNTVTAAGGTDVYAVAYNGSSPPSYSFAAAWGPPPDKWAPPAASPEIAEQYAVAADPDAATVRASVNPQFWADTSYRVEYGTGKCSEGGCPLQTTEAQLNAGVTNAFKNTPQVTLPDLAPATTYHFRFVAQSSGGGPVYGPAPEGGEASVAEGLEGAFTTPAPPAPLPASDPCPNALFRSGPSAFLPDCRAYEMVSPVDKDNGEILHLGNISNEPLRFNQSTLDGEKLAYSSYRAFGDAESAPAASQYMAMRGPEGWATDAISPPRGTPYMGVGPTVELQYRAFSEDLCQGWLWHDTDPPLTPDAVTGFPNLYKTSLCGGEQSYEALTRVPPSGVEPTSYVPSVQGVSADGSVTVFKATGQLEVDAGPKARPTSDQYDRQCYQLAEGRLRLVSVLPNGLANPSSCSIGTGGALSNPHESNLDEAVSEDGSRIYWSASSTGFGRGRIYLRIDGKNPTVAVSAEGEALSGETEASRFLAATADGSKAIYSVGEFGSSGAADLYEFDLATQTSSLIAGEARGIVGASEDASRIYLVSREALAAGATGGKENLYLYEAGVGFRFIGALSPVDARAEPPFDITPVAVQPNLRSARLSADGLVAVFTSTARLTGFDNTDAESGEADIEVFRYDASANGGAGRLDCVSCNPSGVRPSGRLTGVVNRPPYWVAARIPPWDMALY